MIDWIWKLSMTRPEGLHLLRAAIAHLLGELVLVADHVLDGHRTRDRTEMTDENVLHLGLELRRGAIKETPRGVGDRTVVVADLVDDHTAQIDADLLLGDARHTDLALVRLERKAPDLA